jgi:hypothetical protein
MFDYKMFGVNFLKIKSQMSKLIQLRLENLIS